MQRKTMAITAPGQLNVNESPSWGSRSVDCFEKLEQIGEGTYGYAICVFKNTLPHLFLVIHSGTYCLLGKYLFSVYKKKYVVTDTFLYVLCG